MNLPRKPSRIDFEAVDSHQIERILKTGDLGSLTPAERDYFDLKSDAYGLSDWMARRVYTDALNFFYAADDVRPKAWANFYAERFDKLANLAASMGKLKEAKSNLVEAAKLRGCYDEQSAEIPQELLDAAPVVLYTSDPESMGAPKADRKELEAFIDSIPDIPEISRRRIKEDAGIKKRNLLERIISDVKEFGDEEE